MAEADAASSKAAAIAKPKPPFMHNLDPPPPRTRKAPQVPPGVGPPPKAPAGVIVRHRWLSLPPPRYNDGSCDCTGCGMCRKAMGRRECCNGLPAWHDQWDYDLCIQLVQEWDENLSAENLSNSRRSVCKKCRGYWWGYLEEKQKADTIAEFGPPPEVEQLASTDAPSLRERVVQLETERFELMAHMRQQQTQLTELTDWVQQLTQRLDNMNTTQSTSWGWG
jgi:hypothetical protein